MIDPRLLQVVGDFLLPRLKDDHPALIGIAGSQGSGKSTLAAELATRYGGVALSLDDVYLTQKERQVLAGKVHPLFVTRGPPLTHDLGLLDQVLLALSEAKPDSRTALPAFDKLADDRRAKTEWHVYVVRPRLIVLEGWCLGAEPEPQMRLASPVNSMEALHDSDGVWRKAINGALKGDYAALRSRLDGLIYLRAPSFERVLDWRCQQEAGLMGLTSVDEATRARLAGFIERFERLTRWMLEGGIRPELEITLDDNRHAVAIKKKEAISDP